MKTAVIDVGGGMRGIYAAGVLDTCLENGINFDLGIGVSAGSANIASFLARQRGRNFVFYTNYALRKEYMGIFNFFFKRNYVNLDYAYGTLSNSDGEFPIDYPAMKSNHMDFLVVATNALTGEAKYMRSAEEVILYAATSGRCLRDGILRDEGSSMDQSIFKAVYIPYAVNLTLDEDALYAVRSTLKPFLMKNAEALRANLDRSTWPAMYCDYYWGNTFPETFPDIKEASMGAQTSGASLMEGVARLVAADEEDAESVE